MPTYDFICFDCRKRFDIFMTYSEYGVKPVACSHCGSANARRRVPRVRVLKSDEQRLSALGDPSMLDGIDDDPIALGRMMRKMGSELGEDLPPEFGDVVDVSKPVNRLKRSKAPSPTWLRAWAAIWVGWTMDFRRIFS